MPCDWKYKSQFFLNQYNIPNGFSQFQGNTAPRHDAVLNMLACVSCVKTGQRFYWRLPTEHQHCQLMSGTGNLVKNFPSNNITVDFCMIEKWCMTVIVWKQWQFLNQSVCIKYDCLANENVQTGYHQVTNGMPYCALHIILMLQISLLSQWKCSDYHQVTHGHTLQHTWFYLLILLIHNFYLFLQRQSIINFTFVLISWQPLGRTKVQCSTAMG